MNRSFFTSPQDDEFEFGEFHRHHTLTLAEADYPTV